MKLPGVSSMLVRHGLTLRRLVDEVAGDPGGAVVVAGDRLAAERLHAELAEEAGSDVVRLVAGAALAPSDIEDALVAVHVQRGEVSSADEMALRHADRARVPVVCLSIDAPNPQHLSSIPYVLAEDVVHAPGRGPLPIERLAGRIAVRAGPRGFALAANAPGLRRPVCDAIVAHYSRLNAAVGAAVFVPGVDLPVLTLNQLRMVSRIAAAHSVDLDARRLVELMLVVTAGLGLRSAARYLTFLVPVAGWVVKGGVAFAGTQAIGRAAIKRFESMGSTEGQPAGGARLGLPATRTRSPAPGNL